MSKVNATQQPGIQLKQPLISKGAILENRQCRNGGPSNPVKKPRGNDGGPLNDSPQKKTEIDVALKAQLVPFAQSEPYDLVKQPFDEVVKLFKDNGVNLFSNPSDLVTLVEKKPEFG